MLLYALTIFVSAFLLFLVQPIIGKQILPWFGGTAAVWSTCLVFFQVALLAGYFYSDWISRRLPIRRQVIVHFSLIVVALALLPIIPSADWKPAGDEEPSVRILLLLAATIGLPYFLLSTTSPLVQVWFARTFPTASPYRLFALSNLASMLALLSYPFLVEPTVSTHDQAVDWSIGFGLFALLAAGAMWRALKADSTVSSNPTLPQDTDTLKPTLTDKVIWIALAAFGSSLLLGVSNHLTQNISSIPLLWVLPLAIYLLTFIVTFTTKEGAPGWYPRTISLPQTAMAIMAMAWLLAEKKLEFMLLLHIAVFSGGLLITCLYCHGELAARKPNAKYLTTFYLMVSVGGAVGSFLVGIVAPLVLHARYELGITLYLLAILATWLVWRDSMKFRAVIGGFVCLMTLWCSIYTMHELREDTVVMARNFYGALRVKEYDADDGRKRSLVHGQILHGDQYLDPIRKLSPTTYYIPTSGVGLALSQKKSDLRRPRRVGIIGLGAGTLAAYSSKDDVFRFYEINEEVVAVAKRDFSYITDTEADIEIALGDARLNLEREPAQNFDVLAIDAFSSDSIPVHLITLEALAVYEKHMQPDGIIAFHVSNRFLQLEPVVDRIARERGLAVAWIEDTRSDGSTSSDWILLSKDPEIFSKPEYVAAIQPIPQRPNWRMWTDDFNNLYQVLK